MPFARPHSGPMTRSAGTECLPLYSDVERVRREKQLVAFDESGEVRTLYPIHGDRFFAGHGAVFPTAIESRIEFQRNGQGKLISLIWRKGDASPAEDPLATAWSRTLTWNSRSATLCPDTCPCTRRILHTCARTTLHAITHLGAHTVPKRVHLENAYFPGSSFTCSGRCRTATSSVVIRAHVVRNRWLCFLQSANAALPTGARNTPAGNPRAPFVCTCSRCTLQQFAPASHPLHPGHIATRACRRSPSLKYSRP